jgi:peptidoglycan glycosyltransferase
MMVAVVRGGTGTAAAVPGHAVAGKTGTAEAPGGPPHAWFIGFAPAEAARFAIAVIVERGGDVGDEATGGRVAAPVAGQVLAKLLALPPVTPQPRPGGR